MRGDRGGRVEIILELFSDGKISSERAQSCDVDSTDWRVYSERVPLTLRYCGVGESGFAECNMNLPNSLTILRIFFVPILVVVLLTREPNLDVLGLAVHYEIWGVLILLVAAATDAMDGYLARKRGEITTLGILLDPIADKLLISATFISLVEMGLVSAWMVVIIIGREFIVLGLRSIASAEGLIIAASPLGKSKMVLQVLAGCAVILGARHLELRFLAMILLWLVVVSAVASAVHYFLMFWNQVDDRVKQRHRRAALVLEQEKKTQDVTAP
jgi:CDP-diacylglycerol--glycerol-3-phosphate 3-phosphatidyltransferase